MNFLTCILRNSFLLIIFCVAGCGYHSSLRVNDITNVAVPIFDNKTTWRELELELTNLVHREVKAKTPFRLVSRPEEADIIIVGEILDYYKPVIVEDSQDQVIVGASKITIRVSIKDQKTGVVIVTKNKTVQSEFLRGSKETLLDAEYRGRQNTFEQIGSWIISLLENM
jgi:hypothetical protein